MEYTTQENKSISEGTMDLLSFSVAIEIRNNKRWKQMEPRKITRYTEVPEYFEDIELFELFKDGSCTYAIIFENGTIDGYNAEGKQVYASATSKY